MNWHRLLFWIPLFAFFGITVGAEGGYWSKESIGRFAIYTGLIAALMLLTDKKLIPMYLGTRRYALFTLLMLLATAATIVCAYGLDTFLLGPPFGGWENKLTENTAFIAPWTIIGLCLLIADYRGRKKVEETRNELNYLRHQVNPHFLLNTHNNIHFLIEDDPALAADMLLRLSGIMQYMLYECSGDTVSLAKELQNLENYIALERIRKDASLEVKHNFDTFSTDAPIAPLLLISFVENAFKHVSAFTDRPNFIRMAAELNGDEFYFTVTNSKGGAQDSKRSGIGLQNVQQRLRLLYPKKHKLQIDDQRDVFHVQLRIVLK